MSALPRSPIAGVAVLVAGVLLTSAACGTDDAAVADDERPEVVFVATGSSVSVPDEVPSGYVDIRIESPADPGAHLLIGRLDDGVTYEEFEAAPPTAEGLAMITVVGGNGTIPAGSDTVLTARLDPGDYSVVSIFGQPPQLAYERFRVVQSPEASVEPDSDGTIGLGPGMRIAVPDEFDGSGTWRFENTDTSMTHEAALVRLADGAGIADLIRWFQEPDGPPPIAGEFGSMGALGPGREAWIRIGPVEPGEYALICFVPDLDGVPHVANGMVAQVTIPAS